MGDQRRQQRTPSAWRAVAALSNAVASIGAVVALSAPDAPSSARTAGEYASLGAVDDARSVRDAGNAVDAWRVDASPGPRTQHQSRAEKRAEKKEHAR